MDRNQVADVYLTDWQYEWRNPYAEEPSDNVATNFYVTIADHSGRTWCHNFGLSSASHPYWECEERINKLVERIKNHLEAGGSINLDHWDEGTPRYGSEAWIRFEREELQPVGIALSEGRLHEDDLCGRLRGYF